MLLTTTTSYLRLYYPLGNPADNQVFGTILGCFQGPEAASKIQFGTAWWFNDNKDGMEAQIKALGNLGVLGKFVGMLTDSRSFLSYPRHEYFRKNSVVTSSANGLKMANMLMTSNLLVS